MYLQSLKLLHFRNYDHLEVQFHPNLNIFHGKNGAGKTNLVEAIYVLALTKSFRSGNDRIMISMDSTLSKIEGEVSILNKPSNNYRIFITKDGKKVKINKNKVTRLSEYISKIPIVLFHPDDLKIIKDTPSTRRKQLNISISQFNLDYLKNLSVYNKLLKQRNSYLKKIMVNANQSYEYLDILTEKLVVYGQKVYLERQEFLSQINQHINVLYEKITGIQGLEIRYYSDYSEKSREQLLKMYQNSLKKDLAFGKTTLGIHTDDICFCLNQQELKDYGSEGQQKNAVIAYKLGELELLQSILGYYPILILDDLFSELDKEKIGKIFHMLKNEVQTFITTTELSQIDPFVNDCYKSFEISLGNVVEEMEHER